MTFRLLCPYCPGDQLHWIESEFYDEFEAQVLRCLDRADPERVGRVGYVPLFDRPLVERLQP